MQASKPFHLKVIINLFVANLPAAPVSFESWSDAQADKVNCKKEAKLRDWKNVVS